MPRRADEGCCPKCGLFEPCPVCGKTRLSMVPVERTYTRAELLSAVQTAWTAGWVTHRDRTMTSESGDDLRSTYLRCLA